MPSHDDLDADCVAIGRRLAALPEVPLTDIKELKSPPGHKPGFLEKLFKMTQSQRDTAMEKNRFKNWYRRQAPKTDEAVSTETVYTLVKGIMESHSQKPGGLSDGKKAELIKLFNNVSAARQLTHEVGYTLAVPAASGAGTPQIEGMNHPTNRNKALFYDPHDSASASKHWHLDLERRALTVAAMKAQVWAPGTDAHKVVNAGIRTATAFTVNEMNAPITADNVRPHALKGSTGAIKPHELQQVEGRDHLKRGFEAAGGQLKKPKTTHADTEMRRPYESHGNKTAPPSPMRANPQH